MHQGFFNCLTRFCGLKCRETVLSALRNERNFFTNETFSWDGRRRNLNNFGNFDHPVLIFCMHFGEGLENLRCNFQDVSTVWTVYVALNVGRPWLFVAIVFLLSTRGTNETFSWDGWRRNLNNFDNFDHPVLIFCMHFGEGLENLRRNFQDVSTVWTVSVALNVGRPWLFVAIVFLLSTRGTNETFSWDGRRRNLNNFGNFDHPVLIFCMHFGEGLENLRCNFQDVSTVWTVSVALNVGRPWLVVAIVFLLSTRGTAGSDFWYT